MAEQITYKFVWEEQPNGNWLCGLKGSYANDKAGGSAVWKQYGSEKPTEAQLKADFTLKKKTDQGEDIPGSSLKDQLDKWFNDREQEKQRGPRGHSERPVTFQ